MSRDNVKGRIFDNWETALALDPVSYFQKAKLWLPSFKKAKASHLTLAA